MPAAVWPFEFRSIDGLGNNPHEPALGASETEMVRLFPADYGDGLDTPAGSNRPSPRFISNQVSAQTEDRPNRVQATDFVWQWGQFLDHDLDETPIGSPTEAIDILVPAGDLYFDPLSLGTVTIPMDRSSWVRIDGVRQQINEITAFIDASNVYGTDATRAAALRTMDGTGKLKTSQGDLLPYNLDGLANAPAPTANFFLAGDIRANEQVGLTAMHTLFVREHNFWAGWLLQFGIVDGDLIYELARAMIVAEMQAISYREFL
ncbi:MAG: peroxidase family protein, partial [Planctomycetes bacterium]|nr:peroxidase family protein [Planctomycetota bacterium]